MRPKTSPASWLLGTAAAAAAVAAAVLGLVVAPEDMVQGAAQRLMYVHVPAAWLAYLAFAVVLACSVAYLIRRDLRWDRRAHAAAELGVGMTALAIALGSLWGRPVWGVWWAWDPRVVTTTVMLLVYVGYLGARGLSTDANVNARRSAAVGVLGFVNIPVVHFSVVWWRTLHQPPALLQPGGPAPIDTRMLSALLVGVLAFTLAGAWVFVRRVRQLERRTARGASAAEPGTEPATAPPALRVTTGGLR